MKKRTILYSCGGCSLTIMLCISTLLIGLKTFIPFLGNINLCNQSQIAIPPQQTSNLSNLVLITPKNAAQITEVASIGRGRIDDVALSPDQQHLAVATRVGLWLYSSSDVSHPRILTGHYGPITSVAFSTDGTKLLSGSQDCTARLWDVNTGQLLQVFRGHTNAVTQVTFSPDGKLIGTGSTDQTARLWSSDTGKEIQTLHSSAEGVAGGIRSIAFSPDRQWFAYSSSSGGGDYVPKGAVQFWNLKQNAEIQLFPNNSPMFFASKLGFSPDSKMLVMNGGLIRGIQIFDFPSGKQIQFYAPSSKDNAKHFYEIDSFQWKSDNHSLAVSFSDVDSRYATAIVLDISSGKVSSAIDQRPGTARILAFTSDRLGVLYTSDWSTYNLENWKIDADFKGISFTEVFKLTDYSGGSSNVSFSPDSKLLAFGDGTTVRVRDIYSEQQVMTLSDHAIDITHVAFSPDGKYIATSDYGGIVRLWDATQGTLLWAGSAGSYNMAHSVAFDPQSKLLLSTSGLGGDRSAIKLWDVNTGKQMVTLSNGAASNAVFSPDGATVAAAPEGFSNNIEFWSVATHKHIGTLKNDKGWILDLVYSPNGKLLATANADFTAQLFDVATGKQLAVFGQPFGYNTRAGIAFNPNSSILATVHNNIVMLWDTTTLQQLAILSNHKDRVQDVTFSPDGKLLATASDDNTVRLWGINIATATPVQGK